MGIMCVHPLFTEQSKLMRYLCSAIVCIWRRFIDKHTIKLENYGVMSIEISSLEQDHLHANTVLHHIKDLLHLTVSAICTVIFDILLFSKSSQLLFTHFHVYMKK